MVSRLSMDPPEQLEHLLGTMHVPWSTLVTSFAVSDVKSNATTNNLCSSKEWTMHVHQNVLNPVSSTHVHTSGH